MKLTFNFLSLEIIIIKKKINLQIFINHDFFALMWEAKINLSISIWKCLGHKSIALWPRERLKTREIQVVWWVVAKVAKKKDGGKYMCTRDYHFKWRGQRERETEKYIVYYAEQLIQYDARSPNNPFTLLHRITMLFFLPSSASISLAQFQASFSLSLSLFFLKPRVISGFLINIICNWIFLTFPARSLTIINCSWLYIYNIFYNWVRKCGLFYYNFFSNNPIFARKLSI